MITFIKILEYCLKPAQTDTFDYLAEVTSQRLDPPTLKPEGLPINEGIVLFSPLKRAKDCIKEIKAVRYLELPELKEIPFELKNICAKEEWESEKSTAVRKRFKEAFIADNLSLSREQIFFEIKHLLALVRRCEKEYENVTLISHSFRLKIIEAYLATGGEIVFKPCLIHDFIFDNEKTYEFGSGFRLSAGFGVIPL